MKPIIVNIAVGLAIMSAGSAYAVPIYSPVGPQVSVPIATVTAGGWTQCFSETYDQVGPSISSAVSGCTGSLMMLAGGVTGSGTLDVLAWAPTLDAMFDTGTGNTPHDANGTGWYFNSDSSWGFAPQGAAISRGSCDIAASAWPGATAPDATTPKRLCWHTSNGDMDGGWRVGAAIGLNDDSGYTKYIFTANAVDVPEPATLALMGLGLAGMGFRRKPGA